MIPLILNSSNIVEGTNNSKLSYRFPSTAKMKDQTIALTDIELPYSWYNITVQNYNCFFEYTWYDASGATTKLVQIPDGNYNLDDIQAYIEYTLINNGHYLINSSGKYVYYITLQLNTTLNLIELSCFPIPSSLPSGWANPAGMTFPSTPKTPQLTVLGSYNTAGFQKTIGFQAGTYPPISQSTLYQILGTSQPQIDTISSIIIQCSLLNNILAIPNTILYSFQPTGEFGSIISVIPPVLVPTDIQDGNYSQFEISFVDQNFTPILFNSSNVLVQFALDKKIK